MVIWHDFRDDPIFETIRELGIFGAMAIWQWLILFVAILEQFRGARSTFENFWKGISCSTTSAPTNYLYWREGRNTFALEVSFSPRTWIFVNLVCLVQEWPANGRSLLHLGWMALVEQWLAISQVAAAPWFGDCVWRLTTSTTAAKDTLKDTSGVPRRSSVTRRSGLHTILDLEVWDKS